MEPTHQKILVSLVVATVVGTVGMLFKLHRERRELDKQLQAKEDAQQELKISTLERLIQQQSTAMSDAVLQIKGITDELRTQISTMGEKMEERIHEGHLDMCGKLDTAHKRITELGSEFSELRGEHKRNMETGQCFFASLSNEKDRNEIIEYFKSRVSAGRRDTDKHPLYLDVEDK